MVVRDSQGEVIAVLSEKLHLVSSAAEAEALAFRRAPKFASEVGFFDVEFESDAFQIINTFGDMEPNLLPFGHILEEARSNAASLRSHSSHHAFRECNVVADAVAKYAMSIADLVVWLDEPPSFIVHLIRMDQHFIIHE